jgi:hypothetical protein
MICYIVLTPTEAGMRALIPITLLLLSPACHRNGQSNVTRMYDVAEPPPAAVMLANEPPREGAAQQARIDDSATLPQIAYSYTIGYSIGAAAVGQVQRRHVALCDSLGPARCRIVSMRRDMSGDGAAEASLAVLVDARIARAFQDRLDAAATSSGGSISSRRVEAEDLSKEMVDTAAKVRGKEALAKRLLALLQTHSGKVGELVEAEKAYAQTEEELDAARSWLAEMRGRVTMSKIDIGYTGAVAETHSAWSPLREALSGAGSVVGSSAAKLITLLLGALPWLLVLSLLIWTARRRRWRIRLRWPKRRGAEPAAV